jgi:hypothetical protein
MAIDSTLTAPETTDPVIGINVIYLTINVKSVTAEILLRFVRQSGAVDRDQKITITDPAKFGRFRTAVFVTTPVKALLNFLSSEGDVQPNTPA